MAISSAPTRAEALAGLAPHLPAEDRPNALSSALEALAATSYEATRTRVLASLAPHLPTDLLPAALDNAATLTTTPVLTHLNEQSARTRVLASLAPHLPTDLLVAALTAAGSDSDARSAVLTAAELAYPDSIDNCFIDLYRKAFTGTALKFPELCPISGDSTL